MLVSTSAELQFWNKIYFKIAKRNLLFFISKRCFYQSYIVQVVQEVLVVQQHHFSQNLVHQGVLVVPDDQVAQLQILL